MKKESETKTVDELWRGELKPIAGATGIEEVTYHHDERLLNPVNKVFMSMVHSKTETGATYDFETDTTNSVAGIAINHPEVLQNRDIHISPIRWWDGHRREKSFSCASFIMGEVDGGYSLEQFLEDFKDFDGFVHTSKSHQKEKVSEGGEVQPSCDRFHFALALNELVNRVDDWRRINKCLKIYLPYIDDTFDGARKYRCADNCQVYPLTGNKKLSTRRLLEKSKELKITSNRLIKSNIAIDNTGVVDNSLLNLINTYATKQKPSLHTYQKVWRLMVYAGGKNYSSDIIASTLLENAIIRDYVQRKRGIAPFLKEVANAIECARTFDVEYFEVIAPPTPVVEIHKSELPILTETEIAAVSEWQMDNDITDELAEKITETYGFLKYLIEGKSGNQILEAGCGSGKSVSTNLYIKTHPEQRFLLVKETIKDVKNAKESLMAMGVEAGSLTGFNERHCAAGYTHDDHRTMSNPKTSPCLSCPKATQCLFGCSFREELREEELSKQVLIITHSRFLRIWSGKSVERLIDDGTIIIIDEQLKVFEQFSSSYAELYDFVDDEYEAALKHFSKLQKRISDRGVYQDPINFSDHFCSDLIHRVFGQYHRNYLSEDELDKACEWVSFFGGQANRYCIQADNEQIIWIKDTMLNPLKNKIIMLDGSAKYSCVKWEGFEINTLAGFAKPTYDNFILYGFFKNPTKTNVDDWFDILAKEYKKWSKKNPNARTWVALNKTPLTKVKQSLKKNRIKAKEGFHGSIIGVNDFNDCNASIIGTSLFTTVEDYALTAAVANGTEIPAKEIWKRKGKKFSPKMKEGGFCNELLNEQFRRSFVNILYQYLIRANIRMDSTAKCSAFCFLSGLWSVVELSRLMPNIQVIPIGGSPAGKHVTAYQQLRNMDNLEELSVNTLLQTLDISRNAKTIEDIETLRRIEMHRRNSQAI